MEFGGFAYENNRTVRVGSPYWRSGAAALPDSSVAVTGGFVRQARFDGFELTSWAGDYSTDVFVARLAADGSSSSRGTRETASVIGSTGAAIGFPDEAAVLARYGPAGEFPSALR